MDQANIDANNRHNSFLGCVSNKPTIRFPQYEQRESLHIAVVKGNQASILHTVITIQSKVHVEMYTTCCTSLVETG